MRPRKEHYRGNLPHFQQPGQWYSVTCSLEGAIPKSAMEKYTLQLEIAKNNYLSAQRHELPGTRGTRTFQVREKGRGLSQVHEKGHGLSQVHEKGHGLSKVRENHKELGNSFSREPDFPSPAKERELETPSPGRKQELGNSLSRAKQSYYAALRKYRLAFDKALHNSKTPTILLTAENNRAVLEEALRFWEGKRLKTHAWCIMSNHFHWVLSVYEKDENGNPVYLQDILHSVKLYSARRINQNENCNGQLWMHESFETTIRDDRHFVRVVNYTINNPVSAKLVKEWNEWPGTFRDTDFRDMDFPSP